MTLIRLIKFCFHIRYWQIHREKVIWTSPAR